MDLFDLQAKISLDTSEYDRGVRKATNESHKLGNDLKQSMNSGEIATNRLSGSMSSLGESIGGVSSPLASMTGEVNGASSAMGGATASLGAATVGIGVAIGAIVALTAAIAAATKKFIEGVDSVAEYGDNIDKMSQKMNMTAQSYQEWDFIMQHAGTSIDSMQSSMKTLASAAENGNKAFKKLGISSKELKKMSQEEIFAETIKALQNVESETERTYLAGQLLGRGATELGALLNMSADEVDDMREQLHKLGGVMSDEAVKSAAAFQDSLKNVKTAIGGIKNTILQDFMPQFTAVMDGFTMILSGDVDEGIDIVASGIEEIVDTINEKLPPLFEAGNRIVTTLVNSIDYDKLIESGMQILFTVASGIVENLPTLARAAVSMWSALREQFFERFSESLPEFLSIVLELIDIISGSETRNKLNKSMASVISALGKSIAKSLPMIFEQLPDIISNVFSDMQSTSVMVNAGIDFVSEILKGMTSQESISALIIGIGRLIESTITEFLNSAKRYIDVGKKLWSNLAKGFSEFIKDPIQWGKDLIDNFVSGIKSKFHDVVNAVKNIGQTIADYLGFSEPKKGALSNFHTYAPDMMDLFANGIKDNESVVTDQIKDSFDFRELIGAQNIDVTGRSSSGLTIGTGAPGVGTRIENVTINVSGANYGDERSLAEAIAEELQRMVERKGAVYA